MEIRIAEAAVHYREHGEGLPIVALHGAGVDHREIEAALEAVVPTAGYRRIYPDLPGMGGSTADGLSGNDDVVRLLAEFIERLDAAPALLIGHSYGAYLARGIAAMRPELVRGLALICPVGGATADLPDHEVAHQDDAAYDELEVDDRAGFDDYFVVRTPATARRYRDRVLPGTTVVDEPALERIFAGWQIDLGSATFAAPTLIVAGRRDATAGYDHAAGLVGLYPRAALAILEDVGHALLHESPDLFGALVRDWLERTRGT